MWFDDVIGCIAASNPYTGKDEVVPMLRAIKVEEVEKPIAAYIFPVDI